MARGAGDSTSTERTIEVLLKIFAIHGLPRVLVTDNGPQFTAKEFADFLKTNRIVHHTSAPYHPATNGLAENMVQNVKHWLKKQDKGPLAVSITAFLRTYTATSKSHDFREHIWTKVAYSNLYGSTKLDGKIREGKVGRHVCLYTYSFLSRRRSGLGQRFPFNICT